MNATNFATQDSSTPAEHNNPFLKGNFAPVARELDASHLTVRGRIPPTLNGRLFRNGPNPAAAPDPNHYHWFLGEGMLHSIELRDGAALAYRNRWVRTPPVCAALNEEPPASFITNEAGMTTAANTHIIRHGGRLLALEEFSLPTQVSADLTTIGPYDFAGKLRGAMTAHPKVDPRSGELFFFGYSMRPPYLTVYRADASGTLTHARAIDLPTSVMIHDFAITERYLVIMDLPVCFNSDAAQQGQFPFVWQPSNGARMGLIPRNELDNPSGRDNIVWLDIEPCYVYHVFNAYDRDGEVVLDAIRYHSMFADPANAGPDSQDLRHLTRWILNPTTRSATEQRFCPFERGDFPTIDERLVGRRHRYGYWSEPDAICKIDFDTQCVQRHVVTPYQGLAEPLFVADHATADEDEGWLLQVAYNPNTDSSDLLIFDAKNFGQAPVAIVHLPQRVPYGFHGSWMAGL